MKKGMGNIKTPIAVILSLICLNLSSVRADDSDIFGANVVPNVLILFDDSRSMVTNSITATLYNDTTNYTGSFGKFEVYKLLNGEYSLYLVNLNTMPAGNAKTALGIAGFWTGTIGGSNVTLQTGNYINYLACTNCTGTLTRLAIAQRVVTDLLRYVEGVNFGVMSFRANGGELIGPFGSPISSGAGNLVDAVNGLTAPGGNGTPLGDQLRDASRYFQGLAVNGTTRPSPITVECAPNYVIVMSDGEERDSTEALIDVAPQVFALDHSSLTGNQNLTVHTIGFDTGATANAILQTAADGGGGTFYFASDAAQLAISLQDAIRVIVGSVFTFATPVVPTTSVTGSNRIYIAAVQSDPGNPSWRGYLKAYDRQADGSILLNADGTPNSSELAWEAGAKLNAIPAANRAIYYQSVPAGIDPPPRAREDFVPLKVPRGLVGAATDAERDDIVNFIRGVDVLDEDGDPLTTERPWKLGDIFHSTPVLVSPPFLPLQDAGYDAFKADSVVASRPSVLIVGANDGMLHAFRESDGVELWAWVPEHVFLNLKDLLVSGGEHPYLVDASPVAADIKIDGTWKTIVMFGLRRGGKNYYALDITDTTDPTLLWEFNDTNLGETWSEPAIGKIKWSDGSDKYVAFFGGGYDTFQNNRSGKAFFMIDLATGQKLWEYSFDGNASSTQDDRYMDFSLAGNPTAVDLDLDGYIDRVYIGDVGGQLWKFEPTLVDTATIIPATYTYAGIDDNGDPFTAITVEVELDNGITNVELHLASTLTNPKVSPPADCLPDCYVYEDDGNDPEGERHSRHLGYIALDSNNYGGKTMLNFTNMVLTSQTAETFVKDFELLGKRLFEADTAQQQPPDLGEYYPAQAIYGAPSVARDNKGDLWVFFGTGDKNHPLNTSSNRFYGIRDDTDMNNSLPSTINESDLQLVDSSDDAVSTTEKGWYFILGSGEKVLASADTFNHTVFFTTFTPASTGVCGSGGGEARLYAVNLASGFAALDFTSANNAAATANYVGTSRWTRIGDGIPSKPAVIIDPYGNPSVITGTTSQQISTEAAPNPALPQLLGWREVF